MIRTRVLVVMGINLTHHGRPNVLPFSEQSELMKAAQQNSNDSCEQYQKR